MEYTPGDSGSQTVVKSMARPAQAGASKVDYPSGQSSAPMKAAEMSPNINVVKGRVTATVTGDPESDS